MRGNKAVGLVMDRFFDTVSRKIYTLDSKKVGNSWIYYRLDLNHKLMK